MPSHFITWGNDHTHTHTHISGQNQEHHGDQTFKKKSKHTVFFPIFSSISWWHWWLRSRILAGYRWHPGFQYRIQDTEEWPCGIAFVDVFRCFWMILVCSGLPCVHGFWTPPRLGHWGTSGDLVENEGLRGHWHFSVCNICLWKGAIGSEYKIDASYLSPNVSVTAKLEAS